MKQHDHTTIRSAVRKRYGEIAEAGGRTAGGCCGSTSCCGGGDVSAELGYSQQELQSVPEGADLGLGCGNPQAIASLRSGERVLDLGSGAGYDCFLAAEAVGPEGRVIGVDMTPEMVEKARGNALKGSITNTEFRLGEIEHLPAADESVDVIISNCVINLSPDKQQVFHEAWRVLAPGGRLALSDIITTAELPSDVLQSLSLYTGCVSGAASAAEIEQMLIQAGFVTISVAPKPESSRFIRNWAPGRGIEEYIRSADITAEKPL